MDEILHYWTLTNSAYAQFINEVTLNVFKETVITASSCWEKCLLCK